MFEASVLAFVLGRWSESMTTAVALGLLAARRAGGGRPDRDATANISVGIWLVGIAFPWLIGARDVPAGTARGGSSRPRAASWPSRRCSRSAGGSPATCTTSSGHGLAAVMLQVTSARHVLRRDPDAAEEALRTAEDVGRRSMRELRRTVALCAATTSTGCCRRCRRPTRSPHWSTSPRRRAGRRAADARRPVDDGPERRCGDLPDRPGGAGQRGASRAAGADRARGRARRRTRSSLVADTTGPVTPAASPARASGGATGWSGCASVPRRWAASSSAGPTVGGLAGELPAPAPRRDPAPARTSRDPGRAGRRSGDRARRAGADPLAGRRVRGDRRVRQRPRGGRPAARRWRPTSC